GAGGFGGLVGLVERVGGAGALVVAVRVFAAVGVGGGFVQRVGVARAGDLGGDAAHLVLVQAVAGRALGTLRTGRALRPRRTLRAGRTAAGRQGLQVGDPGIERGQRIVHRLERRADVAVAAALDH